jgi:hypothetical protein
MKNRTIKNLSLSKKSISRFNTIWANGGLHPRHESHPPSDDKEWMSLPYTHCHG